METRTKVIAGVVVVALTIGAVALSNGSLFQGRTQLGLGGLPGGVKEGEGGAVPKPEPDLIIVDMVATTSGPYMAGVGLNSGIELRYRVKNIGTAKADTGTTIADRQTVTGPDPRTDVLPNIWNRNSAILPGGTSGQKQWNKGFGPGGRYGITVCADGNLAVSESDETNNCSSIEINVQGETDLAVTNIEKVSGKSPNDPFTFEITIANQGSSDVIANFDASSSLTFTSNGGMINQNLDHIVNRTIAAGGEIKEVVDIQLPSGVDNSEVGYITFSYLINRGLGVTRIPESNWSNNGSDFVGDVIN